MPNPRKHKKSRNFAIAAFCLAKRRNGYEPHFMKKNVKKTIISGKMKARL